MNFMVEDEFLLLMVHNETRCNDHNEKTIHWGLPEYVLNVADRKRLYDIGIRTAHEQPAWQTIEPSKGEYNFDYLDVIINRNREAGLKSLMQLHGWRVPYWIPNEWRARTKDGVYEKETVSLWNKEAQEHGDKLYITLDEHYKDAPDVMFFLGEYQGGEGAYPPTWALYDDAALEDYKSTYGTSAVPIPDSPDTLAWFGKKVIEHYMWRGGLLYPKYKEIWNEQQYLMDTWTKSFGNFVQMDIHREYNRLFPDACVVSCQCTYFDSSHGADCIEFVDRLRTNTKCEVIVEAMYCKGLPTTTPKAIAKGFRGQIVRPAFENASQWLKDSHVENIKVSNEQWRRSKGL
jgi:hypothetical protein